jgi:hypothetical protein
MHPVADLAEMLNPILTSVNQEAFRRYHGKKLCAAAPIGCFREPLDNTKSEPDLPGPRTTAFLRDRSKEMEEKFGEEGRSSTAGPRGVTKVRVTK